MGRQVGLEVLLDVQKFCLAFEFKESNMNTVCVSDSSPHPSRQLNLNACIENIEGVMKFVRG